MTRPSLEVWLYGTRIAVLSESGDRLALRWMPEAAERWNINSTVMSVLLPITPEHAPSPARVRAFFAGLMPEGDARTHLAVDAGVGPDDVFGMMTAYGRDVAGAIVLQPEGTGAPDLHGALEPIDDDAIRAKLLQANANTAPLGVVPGVTSISLAGMQPKIALHRDEDGGWSECLDGAPSTHIIKPGRPKDSLVSDLIYNEAFCLRLARALGLTTIEATVEQFAGMDALVVSRYDREVTATGVRRLHQEDCAQVLGINTDDPERKFQYGKALPSLRRIAEVLDREFARQGPLLALIAFNVAIGNTDAHAKNISVLHDETGALSLAPAYDVSPHRHYAGAGRRSAMDVNGVQDIDAITVTDLVAEGVSWGLRPEAADAVVTSTLASLTDLLADPHDADREGVPDLVLQTLNRRVSRLLLLDGAR